MNKFVSSFVKLTGYPAVLAIFRTKYIYEDRSVQSRRIKGAAIIASNHTSVFDFAAMMFAFPSRSLRCLVAEVVYEKNAFMRNFLRALGAIKVNRDAFDFSFVESCKELLGRGCVIEIYPEARLPLPCEARPLPFKPSTAYIALSSGAPIIPVYTDGNYFNKKRAHIVIGTPLDPLSVINGDMSESEKIEAINKKLRQRILELKDELERHKKS